DDCVEIGPQYQARLPTFQVDRAKLDSHLLELAVQAGCDLWRPAKVTSCQLDGANGQTVNVIVDLADGGRRAVGANVSVGERTVRARWDVDPSGLGAILF